MKGHRDEEEEDLLRSIITASVRGPFSPSINVNVQNIGTQNSLV